MMEGSPLNDNKGRDIAQQRLKPTILSTDHQWALESEAEPCFRSNVELNTVPRSDMERLKTVTIRSYQDARIAWGSLCQSRTLFRIPITIKCDRTFARDSEEAYYVDLMDAFLKGSSSEISVVDIPFVKRSIRERNFYTFSRRVGYFNEHFERRRVGAWLPFDAVDIKYFGDLDLLERFPIIEAWLLEIDQPAALPVPVPLVVFYFHVELRNAQRDKANGLEISERSKRLLFCLQHEFYVLFLAMWWNEAFHGARQLIVTEKTIMTLDSHCPLIPPSTELKPVQVILEHMRTARARPSRLHNWLCFRQNWMEPSIFVWAVRGSGEHDTQRRPVRCTLWLDRHSRQITVTETSSRVYRNSSILTKHLSGPDLEMIPGLAEIIEQQNWNLDGKMNVGEVIANLLRAYTTSQGLIRATIRDGRQLPETDYRHHKNLQYGDTNNRYVEYRGYEQDDYRRRHNDDRDDRGHDGYNRYVEYRGYEQDDYRRRHDDDRDDRGHDGYNRYVEYRGYEQDDYRRRHDDDRDDRGHDGYNFPLSDCERRYREMAHDDPGTQYYADQRYWKAAAPRPYLARLNYRDLDGEATREDQTELASPEPQYPEKDHLNHRDSRFKATYDNRNEYVPPQSLYKSRQHETEELIELQGTPKHIGIQNSDDDSTARQVQYRISKNMGGSCIGKPNEVSKLGRRLFEAAKNDFCSDPSEKTGFRPGTPFMNTQNAAGSPKSQGGKRNGEHGPSATASVSCAPGTQDDVAISDEDYCHQNSGNKNWGLTNIPAERTNEDNDDAAAKPSGTVTSSKSPRLQGLMSRHPINTALELESHFLRRKIPNLNRKHSSTGQ